MRQKGEITVFLTMILVSICALLCTVTESARTAGARCFLRTAVDASMDSLMSCYHRGLWETYHVLGREVWEEGEVEKELEEFLSPYMEAKNWYPMKVNHVQASQMVFLTEGDGRYLEEEILEYMKYGLVGILWEEWTEDTAKETFASLKEAEDVHQVSGLYEVRAKDAVKLEKTLEKIETHLERQKDEWEEGAQCLGEENGGGFVRHANGVVRELKKIPSLVKTYEVQADRLGEELQKNRRNFEAQEHLSENTRNALEEEISFYESYTAEDGERRVEIVSLSEESQEAIAFAKNCISEAEDIMEYIDQWEPEDEDDELDEEALWRPLLRTWNNFPLLWLGMEFGVKDKEKQGWLEKISEFSGKKCLELVLPEGTTVSGKTLSLEQAPSKKRGDSERDVPKDGMGKAFVKRLTVSEYAVRYFPFFEKEQGAEGFYEAEYLLAGKEKDRENLEAVVGRLLALRQGLNLLYILSDTAKRQEARTLAMTITGVTGLLPLTSVLTFFIMAVWAYGEALMDVKHILNEGKVPLMKKDGDWKLGLEGLLKIGESGRLSEENAQEEERGLDYRGYLRLMIFGEYGPAILYRMMDMMQMNLRRKQSDFLMEQCAWQVDMTVDVCGKHVFFTPGLWRTFTGKQASTYDTCMAVSGSYLP